MNHSLDAPKRVLVAEDDSVFRRVIEFTLARAGFQVRTAANGAIALQQLQCESYDCLVTDHQMPEMSGIDLLNYVRGSENLRSMPAILCTAKGLELDSEFLQKRYQLAAVLHKPFSPRKLAELLVGCCAVASEATS